MKYAIAAFVILVAGAVYAVRLGSASETPPPPSGLEPEIAGRIQTTIFAEDLEGRGHTIHCEADAYASVRDGEVKSLVMAGDGREVSIGATVQGVEDEYFRREDGSIDESVTVEKQVPVYWDSEGTLQGGCAPESIIRYDDGTETTVGERDSARPD